MSAAADLQQEECFVECLEYKVTCLRILLSRDMVNVG